MKIIIILFYGENLLNAKDGNIVPPQIESHLTQRGSACHQGIRTKVHKNISLFLFQIVGYEVG